MPLDDIADINRKHNFSPTGTHTRPSGSDADKSSARAMIEVIAKSNGLDVTDSNVAGVVAQLSKLYANKMAENRWLRDVTAMPKYNSVAYKQPTSPDILTTAMTGVMNVGPAYGVDLSQYPDFVKDIAERFSKLDAENLGMSNILHPRGDDMVESMDLERIKKLAGIDNSNEMQLHEALKLVKDSESGLLAAVSDQADNRLAGQETYKHSKLLKASGFTWDKAKGAWMIPADQFQNAKNIISQANKVDYIIDKLEDVQEVVMAAAAGKDKSSLLDQIAGYADALANQTDERAATEEIRRYLTFFANFHQYSFNNRILVYIQRPNATKVASFKKWKEKNRQVKKGATGIAVLVPIFPAGKNPMYSDDPEDKRNQPVGYKVGHVFDIADTEAINPEGEIPEQPQWWGDNTPDETCEALFELIRDAASADGIDVTQENPKHGEGGYSTGGHINISSTVDGANKVSAMIHEYAHELMHWRDKSKFYVGDGIKRAVAELQAESVAFLVLKHYAIPAEHNTTYLALWKANGEEIRNNLQIISRVAEYIIRRVDKVAGMDTSDKTDAVESVARDMANILDESVRLLALAGVK